MRRFKYIIIVVAAALSALMVSCSSDAGIAGDSDITGQPVVFSAGTAEAASTRATVPYMPQGGRFVCRMFHQGKVNSDEFNSFTDAWLVVDNAVGNSVYRHGDTFAEPVSDNKDDYNSDKTAQRLYWQNRKDHVFVALADNNHLSTDNNTESGSLKLNESGKNTYDLKRKESWTKMEEQQDPILAVTKMKPGGSTPEANRVSLFFEHCFSQVQVNVKANTAGGLDADAFQGIDKVELLGVSEEGYVNCVDVTASPFNVDITDIAGYKPVIVADYSEEVLRDNVYGTSFQLFNLENDAVTPGYLSSANGIAFGMLQAIRITWKEKNNAIVHTVTRRVGIKLESGKRYIYNLELGRGTLTILACDIVPWEVGKEYGKSDDIINGKIDENTTN